MAQWLPWITHLQPPSRIGPIVFQRFSAYHEDPASFGLRLVPSSTYLFVYPLSRETLEHMAFHFDDETRRTAAVEINERPGLRAVLNQVATWFRLWGRSMAGASPGPDERVSPPVLQAVYLGDDTVIRDTRPCAVEPAIILSGLESAVYRTCDVGLSREGLVKTLGACEGRECAWEDLAPVITHLKRLRILLELNRRFLSLASRDYFPP
jgi:magnesium-protoporphyrin IX monomethyl ester (oxidative) cyclase